MSIQLNRLVVRNDTLQKILNFLPYPFLVSRLKDGVRYNAHINQKFTEEIGYTLDEIPTMHDWFQCAYPDAEYRNCIRDEWIGQVLEAQDQGLDSVSMQVLIRTKHYKDRWYEVKASISDPQMVAFIDIHDAKTQEENLKMLNQNRDRVLSILGHDLRGPINQLYALSQMALRQQISQEEFARTVTDVNDRALQTMEFLSTTLTWARSNFDAIRIKQEEVHLKTLAEEVAQLYEGTCSDKNIRVVFSIDSSFKITADREIIVTVLRNLISNAIKFTDRNGCVEIISHQKDDSKHLVVKDTGIGMDKSTIDRILSSNYSSSVGTQGEKGLGIGIMLCHDLLKRMGASLYVESAVGKGTSMRIVIP